MTSEHTNRDNGLINWAETMKTADDHHIVLLTFIAGEQHSSARICRFSQLNANTECV